LLFTGSSLGAMIAAPLASRLYGHFGWRGALLGTSIVGLSWIPLWLAATGRRTVAAQLDTVPVSTDGAPRPSFRELMVRPSVVRGIVGIMAVAPAAAMWMSWGSKFLVKTYTVKQEDVGGYLWLPPLCFDVGAILFGDLFARTRRPRALVGIALAMTACVALVPATATPWASIAVGSISVAGALGLYTVVTSDMMTRVPPGSSAVAGGLIAAGQSLAGIIAGPLIGHAVDAYGNYDVVLWCIGAWTVPGTLVWLLWKPSK
jgi:ACS family hexuronate transporter-like MFS transporter